MPVSGLLTGIAFRLAYRFRPASEAKKGSEVARQWHGMSDVVVSVNAVSLGTQ